MNKSSLTVIIKDYSEGSIKGQHEIKKPDEFDLQIQYDRVLLVLDTLIDRIKVAICLPIFLRNNSSLMYQYLSPEDVKYVNHRCLKYVMPLTPQKSVDTSVYSILIRNIALLHTPTKLTSISQYDDINSNLIDLHMKQVIDILCKNYKLKIAVQDEYKFLVDSDSVYFVNLLQQLRGIVANKITVSAAEQEKTDKALSKAWKGNKELKDNIAATTKEIGIQRRIFAKQFHVNTELIQELKSKIRNCNDKYRSEVKNFTSNIEMNMVYDSETSRKIQIDLASQAKMLQQQHETLLYQHLNQEKKLHAKKSKIEQQLVSWLNKYDSDMTERQIEIDEVTEGFNEERKELEALEQKFDEQLEIYQQIIGEKEEEEYEEWLQILANFVRNRAARVIQRWVRKIFLKSKEKTMPGKQAKGKRKGKGKRK
ncbi:hypothetical protein FQR65_LT06419 [Abscondita terminalis]|nr:hypothetical protein FQR65_LT06419 [Abscondita terminalis]